jgi:3-oxoacyl-[acyl-carrier protein] reductase
MGRLEGKVALVTGASKGIGASIARALAADGAAVAVNYVSSREGAERVVADVLGKGGRALAVQGDVATPEDVSRIFAETLETFGRLDILVNNAGIYEFAPIEAVTEEHFHKQFNLNVLGLLLATKEAVKAFGANGGTIINVGSGVSRITPPNSSVYTATKGAVDAITGVLAKELGPRRIRVNSINPGMIETEGVRAAGMNEGELRRWIESQSPLGRIGQTDDIAPTAVFLASADSKYMTGETLLVSGGVR